MDQKVFINSRKRLLDALPNGSLVVLFAGMSPRKSGDENYDFTPNRNFYYLTGDDEPEDIVVLKKVNNTHQEVIFIKPYDAIQAKWVGETYTADYIRKVSGINNVVNLEEFTKYIQSFIGFQGIEKLYLDLERQGYNEASTPAQDFAHDVLKRYPHVKIENVFQTIAALREVKCEEEVELMKKAIDITEKGIMALLENIRPEENERNLDALFSYTLKVNNSEDVAFKTIAASGINSCVLHYNKNNCELVDGDLILFDLGAQYQYYKADISRTFPVNGTFTPRQKVIYDIVLRGQKLVISSIKPGITTRDLNQILVDFYGVELQKIGLIKDKSEVRKYYFHGVSHHLGLDTHDVTNYGLLKPGNIITVEPGLYIEDEKIGIRIEDDVLVTKDGCINLSSHIIKEIDDIEKFMKNKKR